MKAKSVILAVVALAFGAAEAAAQPFGTVSWNAGQPQSGNGSISGTGTYTAAAGWTPTGITMIVVPTKGGLVQSALGPIPMGGKWNQTTVNNLAVGQYAVYMQMGLSNGAGGRDFVCSPVSIITVVNAGGAPPTAFGTVAYAAGDPTPGQGTITTTQNGTYTLGNGITAKACGLTAIPMAGGSFRRLPTDPPPLAASGAR